MAKTKAKKRPAYESDKPLTERIPVEIQRRFRRLEILWWKSEYDKVIDELSQERDCQARSVTLLEGSIFDLIYDDDYPGVRKMLGHVAGKLEAVGVDTISAILRHGNATIIRQMPETMQNAIAMLRSRASAYR